MAVTANTEDVRSQINTCQNSVLSVEALNHIPKTDNYLSICRVQNQDVKQTHQSGFLMNLNSI